MPRGIPKKRTNDEQASENHVSYIYGKVETLIEYYARSNGLSFATLADGVAKLLRHQKGR